jgi:hemerythrin-like domain-containing protein
MTTHISTTQASDPWEMALIHSLIRRGFEEAREVVLTPDAPVRADAVAQYVGFHLAGLQAHHSTEDEFIWPALHERATMSGALIRRMEEQHSGLHDALDTTQRELTAWEASPTTARSAALAQALGTVVDRLTEHLTEEERDVVPLIAAHITQAEWDHAGEVAFSKFTPKQRFIAMGEMLAAASPTEAARMLAGLPGPIKVIWRLAGRRRYQRFKADLRGESSQTSSDRKEGTPMTRSRAAAWVTWVYAAMFGVPAVPVAIFLAENGRLPSLWGLFDMYGGPWSSQFADDRVVALLLLYSGLVLAAVFSGWLLWRMRKAGAVLNVALLPLEAVFWSGFALPVPWLFGIARVALVALAWPELSRSRGQAPAATPGRDRALG